jgi:benzodiazapine receptor
MNLAYIYVIVPILIAIILNVVIFKAGYSKTSKQLHNPMIPPGWIVGLIWVIIFGILGYAFYLLIQAHDTVSATLLVVLFIVCLLYPFYTNGLSDGMGARLGNLSSLIIAFIVTVVIAYKTPSVTFYMIPILVWASYVNIATAIYL